MKRALLHSVTIKKKPAESLTSLIKSDSDELITRSSDEKIIKNVCCVDYKFYKKELKVILTFYG